MLASFPAAILNHIPTKKGIPRFNPIRKDSSSGERHLWILAEGDTPAGALEAINPNKTLHASRGYPDPKAITVPQLVTFGLRFQVPNTGIGESFSGCHICTSGLG